MNKQNMTYINNGILYELYSQWNIIHQEREKILVTAHKKIELEMIV